MTILKIKQGTDPYLRRKSIDVKKGEDLTKLADDMIETMLAHNGILILGASESFSFDASSSEVNKSACTRFLILKSL